MSYYHEWDNNAICGESLDHSVSAKDSKPREWSAVASDQGPVKFLNSESHASFPGWQHSMHVLHTFPGDVGKNHKLT